MGAAAQRPVLSVIPVSRDTTPPLTGSSLQPPAVAMVAISFGVPGTVLRHSMLASLLPHNPRLSAILQMRNLRLREVE